MMLHYLDEHNIKLQCQINKQNFNFCSEKTLYCHQSIKRPGPKKKITNQLLISTTN